MSQLVEIRLHGELARDFGKVWHLAIDSAREAIMAIEANMPGIRAKVMELAGRGLVFRVRSKNHDYAEDDIDMRLGSVKRIDIIPLVRGASAGVRFVVGAVLAIVGVFTYNPYLVSMGVSLMLGSVVEWLTPKPKKADVTESKNSWTLSGATNNVDQGQPVPVIYGEVLAPGYTISAALSAAQVSPAGSLGPDIAIGGSYDQAVYPIAGQLTTVKLQFSVGAFNITDPMTYSWTVSGFSSAQAVRVTGTNAATVYIELDIVIASFPAAPLVLSGSLSCSVNGRQPNRTDTVNVTKSQSVVVTAYVQEPWGGF
jgi:predicted phage tail protein